MLFVTAGYVEAFFERPRSAALVGSSSSARSICAGAAIQCDGLALDDRTDKWRTSMDRKNA